VAHAEEERSGEEEEEEEEEEAPPRRAATAKQATAGAPLSVRKHAREVAATPKKKAGKTAIAPAEQGTPKEDKPKPKKSTVPEVRKPPPKKPAAQEVDDEEDDSDDDEAETGRKKVRGVKNGREKGTATRCSSYTPTMCHVIIWAITTHRWLRRDERGTQQGRSQCSLCAGNVWGASK